MKAHFVVMPRWIDLAAVVLISAAAFYCMRYQIDPSPYSYDEADYLFAVSRGFAANWTDTPAFTPFDLLRTGMKRGRDPSQRAGVSEWIRESGDMNSYRHWHGPVYYYLLIAINANERSEPDVRGMAFVLVGLGITAIYFGTLWVFRARAPALLAAAMFGLDAPVLVTTEIAPHVLFGIICLAAVFCAAKLFDTGARRYWYGALAVAGVAFCTMEISFALIAALLICGWLERGRLRPDWPFAARSAMAFLVPVILLWPAGLYKLTFLKSYLAMAYLAVFRKGAWGDVTFTETWINRLSFTPVTWALVAGAILLYIARPHLPGRRAALPFLIFGLVMLAAVLRVAAPGPRYTLPFLMPLLVFAGCLLGSWIGMLSPATRTIAVAAVLGALGWEAATHTRHSPVTPNHQAIELLAAVRKGGWEDKSLLVPHDELPVLHYYFPRARLRGYTDRAAIPAEVAAGGVDAVIEGGATAGVPSITSVIHKP